MMEYIKEEAKKLAETIKNADNWMDVWSEVMELCKLAGLEDELANADGDTFEQVVVRAAEALDVEVW